MKPTVEEIYHRFVNYEWNEVGDGLRKSILEAIETALKKGQRAQVNAVPAQPVFNEIKRRNKKRKNFNNRNQ